MSMQQAEIREIVSAVLAEQQPHVAVSVDVESVVNKSIAAVLESFGIEPDDRRELRADFAHLRRWRKSVEGAQTITFKVVVGTLVSGFLAALWIGIKVMFGK